MSGIARIVAVDLDGTLVREDESGDTFPMPGAAEAMRALRAIGYHIVIHTCRIGIAMEQGVLDDEIVFIERMLEDFGIVYDEIHLGAKLIADVYIDDRSIPFRGDWSEVMKSFEG